MAVLPDGSKAYVANKNDKPFVSVIDLKAGRMVGRIPAATGTQGIVASPDGKRVVAADFGNPELIVIDTATDTVAERITLTATPGGVQAALSRRTAGRCSCAIRPRAGERDDGNNLRGKQQVVTVGKDPMGFAFAADGTTALVANHGDGTVLVIEFENRAG